jgi:putative ABC transport system substrate-binding protein
MTYVPRRSFLTLLSGAAAWPIAARAQQPATPVIGGLVSGQEQAAASVPGMFRKGLAEMGYVEGRNVAIELRATSEIDQLPALATELVQRKVAVILAWGSANTARAAKAATATIPIVFANGADPVRVGLVADLARPGGNATGVSFFVGLLVVKRLEMMRELVPNAVKIGFLTDPSNVISAGDTSDLLAAARSIGQQILVLKANTIGDIDAAFASAVREGVGALLIDAGGVFLGSHYDQIVALAARYRIPTSGVNSDFVKAGGLMSYSDDRAESQRQAGVYVGRVLKGEKPADLPVIQPVKFEFAINLKTAKAFGIEFPPSFHLRADVVVE